MSQDPTDLETLLWDHASGALPPAAALLVSVLAAMRADQARDVAWGDALGGAMLEAIAPVPVWSEPLPQRRMGEPARAEVSAWERAERVIAAARADSSAIAWRWKWFGLRHHPLPVRGAALMRMDPGAAAPRHGHRADELTLVLSGCYEDETGAYKPGDLAIAGPLHKHRPRTPRHAGCLCLTATLDASMSRPGAHRPVAKAA